MSKIAASYQIRIHLTESELQKWPGQPDPSLETWKSAVPTLSQIEKIVKDAVYMDTRYFTYDQISVTAERIDK